MRQPREQQSVLGTRRLRLGAVDYDRTGASTPAYDSRAVAGYGPKLAGGGKVRAATAAQAAQLDLIDQRGAGDVGQGPVAPLVLAQRHRLAGRVETGKQAWKPAMGFDAHG